MEKDRKLTLSDLLAFRDGETDDAEVAAAVSGDVALREELARLERMKSELLALPTVTPDAAVWQAIEERTVGRRVSWLQRYPLATAACMFVAAAIAVMVLSPAGEPPSPGPAAQVADPVAHLMVQSRQLESQLFTRASASPAVTTPSEQALTLGIADVDDQLNELYRSGAADPDARERLWRQRVMLLESLAEVQRSEAILRPAIY